MLAVSRLECDRARPCLVGSGHLAPWHVEWGNLTASGRDYVGLALDKLSLSKKTCWHPCDADATHQLLSTPRDVRDRNKDNHTTPPSHYRHTFHLPH